MKHNVDLAIFFLEQGRSCSLLSKRLRKNKDVVMVAVEKNPKSYQYVGKNLKDDDEIFKIAFQQNKEITWIMKLISSIFIMCWNVFAILRWFFFSWFI